MKVLLAALLMFVLGDFVVNHGNGTHQALMLGRHFVTSVSHAGSESVFNQ